LAKATLLPDSTHPQPKCAEELSLIWHLRLCSVPRANSPRAD
jgi:hypothetical protein